MPDHNLGQLFRNCHTPFNNRSEKAISAKGWLCKTSSALLHGLMTGEARVDGFPDPLGLGDPKSLALKD